MSTHNICFLGEIKKKYYLDTPCLDAESADDYSRWLLCHQSVIYRINLKYYVTLTSNHTCSKV